MTRRPDKAFASISKSSSFSQSKCKNTHFYNPKKLYFSKKVICLSILSIGTPMNNLAKYRISGIIFLGKFTKLCFLHFSIVKINNPFKEKKKRFKIVFYVVEPRRTIVPNLLHFAWNLQLTGPLILPFPLILNYFCTGNVFD